ncbi:MAG: SAM-dependent DNA methyltransferase, partial [Proteobacteria bacterium]|nr:SAM-dependent DNA methyltransferase [Pseudomonadota bacterium]
MPTKREIIELLKRDELNEVVERFELDVADRRSKDGLIEAVAASRTATLDEVLGGLKRERLKELCRALRLDDAGREKSEIIARLAGGRTAASVAPAPKPTATRNPRRGDTAQEHDEAAPPAEATAERPVRSARTKGAKSNGSPLGFEAQLWAAADALRNN